MWEIAILVFLAVLIVAAVVRGGASREGYLVYPYIDLDTPGERGNYYALSEPGP